MIPFKHRRRLWTDQEREILKAIYPHLTTEKVAEVMIRSYNSIASEAQILGLHKSAAHLKRVAQDRNTTLMLRRKKWKEAQTFFSSPV